MNDKVQYLLFKYPIKEKNYSNKIMKNDDDDDKNVHCDFQ